MQTEKFDAESILIVDDNPANLGVLFNYLDDLGFNAYVAEDGISAIEQASLIAPDIILLDILMPGIDGFETCRRLKRDPALQHIPVLFMTALTSVEDKIKGFEVGGVDYITKPIQHNEVLARVNAHLTIQRLHQDLEKKNVALQAHNEELDAYARTVSHSLKNSIGAIIGYSEILNEDISLSDQAKQRLSLVIQSANDLNRITDELLLLARVKTLSVEQSPLDMAKIIDASLARLEMLLQEKQPEIFIPEVWPTAIGYAPWIEEVWVNYLTNALKYGGDPPYIKMGVSPIDNGQVQFWIKDNGAGLSEAEQKSLFIEFTRIRTSTTQGHGLGLSIVKQIIHKLGGQVGLQSKPGEGSMFYFTLPKIDPAL